MKRRVRGSEIDEIICMRKNRTEFGALRVVQEGIDFVSGEWAREPLHIIFHENLHRGAGNRTRSLNRAMHAAGD